MDAATGSDQLDEKKLMEIFAAQQKALLAMEQQIIDLAKVSLGADHDKLINNFDIFANQIKKINKLIGSGPKGQSE